MSQPVCEDSDDQSRLSLEFHGVICGGGSITWLRLHPKLRFALPPLSNVVPTIQVTEPRAAPTEVVPVDASARCQADAYKTSSSTSPTDVSGFPLPPVPQTGKARAPSVEFRLPPLVVPPSVPPTTLDGAVELVKQNMLLYLTPRYPPSRLEYDPYSFNVLSRRPRGSNHYAILSSEGVTQVWAGQVTFTSMDDFRREVELYRRLTKIRFFRNFRIAKTWQVWRRSVRCRKVREAKIRLTAYLITLQPPFYPTLSNVAALCHRLSHMGLIQVRSEEPAVVEEWVARQQETLEAVRSRLAAFRSLLLQVVATMTHADENTAEAEGSELISGEKRPNTPRSTTGSSLTRRHSHTSVVNPSHITPPILTRASSLSRMVRVVDLMVASALRTMLHNTITALHDALTIKAPQSPAAAHGHEEEVTEEVCAMFKVEVSAEGTTVVFTPTEEGLLGGLRAVVRACEVSVLTLQPLLPYFSPQDSITLMHSTLPSSPSELISHFLPPISVRLSSVMQDDNPVLRTMLEDDAHLRETNERVVALTEDSWRKVRAEVEPFARVTGAGGGEDPRGGLSRTSCSVLDIPGREPRSPPPTCLRQPGPGGAVVFVSRELGELGGCLARVEDLVERARGLQEVVRLGLLQVDQSAARKVLVTSFRQQQQRMHQDVSQGFDQRVRALLTDANDKWLGLELAPVTAQQVVTLLNYVSEVKEQMEDLNQEEKVIREMYQMIQGYHITLHPEVHNKYEALQKEVKRLRKSVRRSLMELPASVRKLSHLLEKEIEEVDTETAKLAEQVQALRFLRVTSDREEALKMLEAADGRASTIRTQASTITQYQIRFQMPVCPFKELVEVEEEISLKMLLWRSMSEWEELTRQWYQSEVRGLDVTQVTQVTLEYRAKVDYLMNATEHSDVLLHLHGLVTHLQDKLPVLEALTDSALRPRHWEEIDAALSQPLPPAFTLAHVDERRLHEHAHTLQQVAHTAQLQREMENRLNQVQQKWEAAEVPVRDFIRKDVYILGDLAPLDSLLLETELTLHLLLHSQHSLHIKRETVRWKNTHTIIKHTLFEEEWLSLDPVLTTCVAHEVFPLHAATFRQRLHLLDWMKEEPSILKHLRGGMLHEEMMQHKSQLLGLRVCLAPLLAMRRQTCPRLFLLPDSDLLELLTKGQEPAVCHKYLGRLFPGVGRLVHGRDGKIVALVSPQEEVLQLAKPVLAHHGVEDWLGRVESAMRASLKRLVLKHVHQDSVGLDCSLLPLQVVDVCRRILWHNEVLAALDAADQNSEKPDIDGVLQGVTQDLEALTKATKEEDRTSTPLRAARLAFLITTMLELRDTTSRLVRDQPSSRCAYSWVQHLRHHVTGERRGAGVQVSVGVDTLDYGYEYQGVATAAVPTPNTLRARHCLLTAAARRKCGVAVGGVGGGKTETVWEVARAAGQFMATLTCSPNTSAQSLQSVVSGGIQGGFWLLLEEAALLPSALVSRLAQYLHSVRHTKANALKRCLVDGQEMKVVDSFSLFLTVTSPSNVLGALPPPCPLLNHSIAPHLSPVTVCLPSTETMLEVVLRGQGLAVSSEFLQKVRECFAHLTSLRPDGSFFSTVRLIRAVARVCSDIRCSGGRGEAFLGGA
ncbi:hypothetical protein O3P69_015122 [Scylla paramamosain]|uniref:Dynein heavy chain linker domain-containing protein n=1 Tax=Scylla paramamosain TaxID=85552 RepID=A0AAW0T3V5_SCYPA